MGHRILLLYVLPAVIIVVTLMIPNHIRTGDRRYDTWENVRVIVVFLTFWFVVLAAIIRLLRGPWGWISDKKQKPERRGFEVIAPSVQQTDDSNLPESQSK